MPKSQEERLQAIIDGSPRFAPWGASQWESPKGFSWTTVVHGKVPDTVLVRESDHAAVLEVPRYTNLIYVDDKAMAFTCSNDGVPMFYIVKVSQVEQNVRPVGLKDLEGSTFFPSLNRREIVAELPELPTVLAGHYFLENNHFVWSLNLRNGIFNHYPISWFNDANPESGFESIELIRVDPTTNVLVGSGSHIPGFVMDADGKTLLAFIRRYRGDELDSATMRQIERWTARIQEISAQPYLS